MKKLGSINPSSEGFSALKKKVLENSEYLFRKYFSSDFKLKQYYKSPLRDNDVKSSFNLFEGSGRILLFKDWGGNTGNVIDFYMALTGSNYREAVIKLSKEVSITPKRRKKVKVRTSNFELKPIYKRNAKGFYYDMHDIVYWNKMKIPISLVYKHKVYAAKRLLLNDSILIESTRTNPLFICNEYYKGNKYIKSYAPLIRDTSLKFRNNMRGVSQYIVHNYKRLPKKGKHVIITKSFKDNIVLDACGYNVISGQGESMFIDDSIIMDLHSRFDKVFVLYDNDFYKNDKENTGIRMGIEASKKYEATNIVIPSHIKCTDVAEMAEKYPLGNIKNFINEYINFSKKHNRNN